MAFGVKTKNIKTQNSYTIESFFDAIKDERVYGRNSVTCGRSMEWATVT